MMNKMMAITLILGTIILNAQEETRVINLSPQQALEVSNIITSIRKLKRYLD